MAIMAGVKDSTTLGLRAHMKGSITPVASVGMKDRVAPELAPEGKDPVPETSVTTGFAAARPSVGLQRRTPKPASIPALLVGTTTVAPRAATRIGVSRACTAAALVEAVFTEVAAAID
jgi:hypothetical protein